MLSRVLGRKQPVATPNQSIEKLGDTLEVLEKREAVLQKKIDQEMAKAREATKKGNKTAAMTCLKRKKAYEDQLTKLGQQRSNIEAMQMKLEEATMHVEVLNATKAGAKAIKQVYGNLTPDRIDRDMDSIHDAMDQANDIADALSQPLMGDVVDEGDLENELAELEQEEMDKQMLGLDTTPLPKVPTGTIGEGTRVPAAAKEEDDDEEALRRLEAELNM
eukprot:TRINITY_DN1183_c0_g1_i1.p2 TRINITY_DN1183_c0_g1~~TRINITY_DN1183_c0_g1_i1.p2  ORF type:complete len:219 (-),score=66.21 TRINITY_DN1183_c0_g1_i1:333-989(-)